MDSHSGLQLVAYGTLNMAAAVGAAWLGPRRGFTATLVDNGAGDWTVALDATLACDSAADGGAHVDVEVVGPTGGVLGPMAWSTQIVTATPTTIRIVGLDTAGMAADPIIAIRVYRAVAG